MVTASLVRPPYARDDCWRGLFTRTGKFGGNIWIHRV